MRYKHLKKLVDNIPGTIQSVPSPLSKNKGRMERVLKYQRLGYTLEQTATQLGITGSGLSHWLIRNLTSWRQIKRRTR